MNPNPTRSAAAAAWVRAGLGLICACLVGTAATAAEAYLAVTPQGALNDSTYDSGSFRISNNSAGGVRLTRVRIDLGPALFPDLAFDPLGEAGDMVAKCFTPDSNAAQVGLVTPADPCVSPFSRPLDGGYQILTIDFADFRPNRAFSFSVDIDPTVIKGAAAPGPGESGSVSGLELTGAAVEFTFSDGAVLTARLFRVPGSDGGSQATAWPTPPPAPGLQVLGVAAPPTTVSSPTQTVRLSGPPGAQVVLLQVEGALDTTGLPGGGNDVDPFEASSAVEVAESSALLNGSGIADLSVTLTRAGPNAGLNHLVAVVRDVAGRTGATSTVVVLAPESCASPPPRSPEISLDGSAISWTPLPGATAYDLVRGSLPLLRATAGDYRVAVTDCLAAAWNATVAQDPALPAAGGSFFYLVRGRGCGGRGTYDDPAGTSQVGSRDAAIDQAPAACP